MPRTADRIASEGAGEPRIVYSAERIRIRVREIAEDISTAYGPADRLLMIGLLKGSFVFLADLVRAIDVPLHVDFISAASYGEGTASSGDVRFLYDPEAELKGRAVVLVEDIVDSGTTLRKLIPRLKARDPASLEVCALLHKRLTTLDLEPRWVGFDAPNDFLVGYGLDHAEDFRHLPYIASL